MYLHPQMRRAIFDNYVGNSVGDLARCLGNLCKFLWESLGQPFAMLRKSWQSPGGMIGRLPWGVLGKSRKVLLVFCPNPKYFWGVALGRFLGDLSKSLGTRGVLIKSCCGSLNLDFDGDFPASSWGIFPEISWIVPRQCPANSRETPGETRG